MTLNAIVNCHRHWDASFDPKRNVVNTSIII